MMRKWGQPKKLEIDFEKEFYTQLIFYRPISLGVAFPGRAFSVIPQPAEKPGATRYSGKLAAALAG